MSETIPISTRRFCGSRTPSAVGISGRSSPNEAIAIAPRLCLSLVAGGAGFLPSEGGWGNTRVVLPRKLAGLTYDDGLMGGTVKAGSALEMATLPNDLPFALLISM